VIGPSATAMARVLLATIVGVLPVFLLGSLSVLITGDVPLDEQRLGVVAAAFWAASALFSWVAGHVADRVGPAWALSAGAMLSTTSAIGVAVADGLGPLVAMMVLGGAGNAFIVPGSNLAVARSLPPRRQGTAFGLKQAALSSGVLLAGVALPVAVAVGGWRAAFLGAGLLGLVCAGATIPWRRQRDTMRADRLRPPLGPTMPRHGMLVLAVAAGMASATNTSLTAFYVASAVDGGRDPSAAGGLLTAGAALGIAARVVMGRRADRTTGPGLREMSNLLVVGAFGFALLAWPASAATVLGGTILAFGAGWGWTGLYHLAIVRLRPHAPAAASGAASTALFLGSIVGPLGFGTLASMGSFQLAWLVAGVWLLIAAFGVVLARWLLVRSAEE
jgi:MFS family permease